MPTLQELAQRYLEKLRTANNITIAAEEIIEEMEKLTYSNSNTPISSEDKKLILNSMLTIKDKVVIKEADNKNYLQMINYIRQRLEGGKK
ncbi:MAG: hypothetical protein HY811_08330 [Planctomycetes bacterium]|nr:hypothetical protein [Planctomycetota bacterium]